MRTNREPAEIRESMKPWFEGRQCSDVKLRTENQKGWDSAILAATEYVRRRAGGDEKLALEIHELLTGKLP